MTPEEKDNEFERFWEGLVREVNTEKEHPRTYTRPDMLEAFVAGIQCEAGNGLNFELWLSIYDKDYKTEDDAK